LAQRVSVGAKGGTVGLRAHLDAKHRPSACDGARVRIDYSGEGTHEADFIAGCPARYHDPALTACVFEAIRWEVMGGLAEVTGRPWALLPARLVEFYTEATQARDRFLAWRDKAAAKALERK
jgi:hypothetical protein